MRPSGEIVVVARMRLWNSISLHPAQLATALLPRLMFIHLLMSLYFLRAYGHSLSLALRKDLFGKLQIIDGRIKALFPNRSGSLPERGVIILCQISHAANGLR